MITYPSFFFFYSYGAHPTLHSFPTRRSSDLIQTILHLAEIRSARVIIEVHADLGDARERVHYDHILLCRFHHFGVDHIGVDRKSTRLNSSHSQISYAVFCLKKKKKNKYTVKH